MEQERFEWYKHDLDAFYTALDVLYSAVEQAGGDTDLVLSTYFQQKREQATPPEKVIDRMALATVVG